MSVDSFISRARPDAAASSRMAHVTSRTALRAASYLAIYVGSMLLFVPIVDLFYADASLLTRKFVSDMGGTAVVLGLAFGLLVLGVWVRQRLIRLRQADNDRTAQRIMSELRADPDARVPEFYLYLRAFETTGRLHVPLYLRLRKLSIGLYKLETNDVESYVSNAVRKVAPLVALGRPGEAIGAGRVVTEDARWTADVVTLMERAKAILLVPSSRPGTLWEIERLRREGLLTKVVFIMPPRTKGELDTKQRWEAAQQALASLGLETPEHQERGLLFELGPDGKVCNVEPMLLNSTRQVRKSMERILSDDPPRGGLYHAVAIAEKRTRRATLWGWGETLRQLSPYAIAVAALFLDHPDVGFDPRESWATVFGRSMAAQAISEYGLSENMALARSARYRTFEAFVPPAQLDAWRAVLRTRGFIRLSDDELREYYTAWGSMLAAVDAQTCAAIARGDVRPEQMRIAFTYMPWMRVDGFLRAQTHALLAEAEGVPGPPFSEEAARRASEAFLASLGPEGRQRYARIKNAPWGTASGDDLCWFIRTMYGGVVTLGEPDASHWARTLAVMAIPTGDSTATGRPSDTANRD